MSGEDKFDAKKYGENLRDRIHQGIQDGIEGRKRGAGFRSIRPGVFPGLFLVLFGSIILLDHMGIFPADRVWRFWPAILIVVGAYRFVEYCNRAFSVLLMLLGGLLLLGNLGVLHLTWAEMWPIVLIAAGVMMIWGRMTIPKLPGAQSGGANTVTATTMFGGVERRITTNNFTGGTATATFGGVELDFRGADIEGEEAILYVEAIFGGIELVIPERWMAIYEGQSIFGGYNDETRTPLPDVPGAPARKRLILRGQAVFGGITVKN
jgi:predicted membrane protein